MTVVVLGLLSRDVSSLQAQAPADPIALAASVSTQADLDTTVTPCEDFYQYANGGWNRRTQQPGHRVWQIGLQSRIDTTGDNFPHRMDITQPGETLRQLVARSPGLAVTTTDPTLRAVGTFYGSCLVDTTSTAEGTVGNAARASYCFGVTRRYLGRALFELLMEDVWTPAARQVARSFWPNMVAAAVARLQGSRVLADSTRQQLIAITKRQQFYLENSGWRGDTSTPNPTALWSADAPARWPAGSRGPAEMPVGGEVVLRTWIYRDYAGLKLSPTGFKDNLMQVTAAPDTVPLPVMPTLPNSESGTVLDAMLDAWGVATGASGNQVNFGLSNWVVPRVGGQLDVGMWYGMLGAVVGHELGHKWDAEPWLAHGSHEETAAFAEEQFHGQLQSYFHQFEDEIGVLVAYDAFRLAQRGGQVPSEPIDGFTPEQRFFLGVAWGWRGGAVLLHAMDLGVPRWRVAVNGTLSAMPAFARAFECRAGGPMTGGVVWYQQPYGHLGLSAAQRDELAADYEAKLEELREILLGENLGPGSPQVTVTAAQEAAFAKRRQTYATARQQFLGMPGQPLRAIGSTVQVYQLLGEELGELRAVLTPEQQALFDAHARAWRPGRTDKYVTFVATPNQAGRWPYVVAIPGLAPSP